MQKNQSTWIAFALFICIGLCSGCNDLPQLKFKKINYKSMVDAIRGKKKTSKIASDTSNFMDENEFDPRKDSLSTLLKEIENDLTQDSLQIKKLGINDSGILSAPLVVDSVQQHAISDSFTSDIRKIQPDEIKALKYNLAQVKQKDSSQTTSSTLRQKECAVWANIIKSKQMLYLYVNGELSDSFKVSTGDKNHETPLFDIRPSGPVFQKYTSKKYPGGNYKGLGNMPYVVFIKGGYGIHGTTQGNIPKLGKKASHGCIRIHPENAKIFNALVREAGLQNTWITIQN
jgi:lipoprotein-anchoring transpeptidase ErfK/SrfK